MDQMLGSFYSKLKYEIQEICKLKEAVSFEEALAIFKSHYSDIYEYFSELAQAEGASGTSLFFGALTLLESAVDKDLGHTAAYGYLHIIAIIFQLNKRDLPLLINYRNELVVAVVKYRLINNI